MCGWTSSKVTFLDITVINALPSDLDEKAAAKPGHGLNVAALQPQIEALCGALHPLDTLFIYIVYQLFDKLFHVHYQILYHLIYQEFIFPWHLIIADEKHSPLYLLSFE